MVSGLNMKRRPHHLDDDAKLLSNWKVSNFIGECLLRGYHIAYYRDTSRIHYWTPKTTDYHIIDIDHILTSETGLGIGIFHSRANRR